MHRKKSYDSNEHLSIYEYIFELYNESGRILKHHLGHTFE